MASHRRCFVHLSIVSRNWLFGRSCARAELMVTWRIMNGMYQAVSERPHHPRPDRHQRPTKTDEPCVVAGRARCHPPSQCLPGHGLRQTQRPVLPVPEKVGSYGSNNAAGVTKNRALRQQKQSLKTDEVQTNVTLQQRLAYTRAATSFFTPLLCSTQAIRTA